jgi:hypothetical protein
MTIAYQNYVPRAGSLQRSGVGVVTRDADAVLDGLDAAAAHAARADNPHAVTAAQAGALAVGGAEATKLGLTTDAATVAALKAVTPAGNGHRAVVRGYYAEGDDGGGIFYWNAADTTADDGGATIASTVTGFTVTGRWKRLFLPVRVNIRWFGAKGDGVADDRTAIQAAVTYASARGGGVVYVPAGIYLLSVTIGMLSKVRLIGAGRGATVLRLTAGSHSSCVEMAGVDRCTVESLTVDNATNAADANGIAVKMDGSGNISTNCTVRDCEVLGANTHQYLIWCQRGQRVKFLNNFVDGGLATYTAASQQEGIEVLGGYDVLVDGNTVRNIGNNGLYCQSIDIANAEVVGVTFTNNNVDKCKTGFRCETNTAGANDSASFVKATGNTLRNCWDYGAYLSTLGGILLRDLQFEGNTIWSVGGGTGSQCGILVQGDATVAASDTNAYHVVVGRNVIEHCTGTVNGHGIWVNQMANVRLLFNNVRDTGNAGILISASNDIDLAGNRLTNLPQWGIQVQNTCARVRLTGANYIKNWNTSAVGYPAVNFATGSVDCCSIDTQTYQGTSANDYTNVRAQAGSDRITIRGTTPLYNSPSVSTINQNLGTNPNAGTMTMTAGATTTNITHTLVESTSIVRLIQTAGPPTAFRMAVANGVFGVTFAANAAGTETFAYEIVP